MSEEYKIDDDVPMPRRRGKYPLGELDVGQSFFVPDARTDQSQFGDGPVIVPTVSVYGAQNGKKFTCLRRTENGVVGVRVWRKE